MDQVLHVGAAAVERLRSLGLAPDDICEPLRGASAEARMCTDMDSPGMPGYSFWSRTNRYFRERKITQGWTYSNTLSILRCIHPSGDFAVTAVSASGRVGDEAAPWAGGVRTKNPKGSAIAQLVQYNELALFPLSDLVGDSADLNDIVTWFLLYKSDSSGLSFELSLPTEMHGKAVDTWRERIILSDNPLVGPEFDIKKLDAVPDEIPVEVQVDFKGTSS